VNPDSLIGNPDAGAWAREFHRLFGTDEGLMLAWFACAIETGRDAARSDETAWRTAFECAGAATRPLLEDFPTADSYVFPAERVSEAVRSMEE
jgi:hypothetical protein